MILNSLYQQKKADGETAALQTTWKEETNF